MAAVLFDCFLSIVRACVGLLPRCFASIVSEKLVVEDDSSSKSSSEMLDIGDAAVILSATFVGVKNENDDDNETTGSNKFETVFSLVGLLIRLAFENATHS